MKIYHPTQGHGLRSIAVAPAAMDPTARVPEWQDENGDPVTVTVRFRYGMAEVEDPIGRFLVAKGLAKKTRPLLLA